VISIIIIISGILLVIGGAQETQRMVHFIIFIRWYIDIFTGFLLLFAINTNEVGSGVTAIGVGITFEIIAIIIELISKYGNIDSSKKEEDIEIKDDDAYLLFFLRFIVIVSAIAGASLVSQGAQGIMSIISTSIVIQWYFDILVGFFLLFLANTSDITGGLTPVGIALMLSVLSLILELYFIYKNKPDSVTPSKTRRVEPEKKEIKGPITPDIKVKGEIVSTQNSESEENIRDNSIFIAKMGVKYSQILWNPINSYDAEIFVDSNEILIKTKKSQVLQIKDEQGTLKPTFQSINIPNINIQYDQIESITIDDKNQVFAIQLINEKKYFVNFKNIIDFYNFNKIISNLEKKFEIIQLNQLNPEKENEDKKITQEKLRQEKKVKMEAAREILKKMSQVYNELPFEKLALRMEMSIEDLEKLVEDLILNGELQARMGPNSIFFLNKKENEERKKEEKLIDYLIKVLKIRLAKGEISEEDFDRIIQKICRI